MIIKEGHTAENFYILLSGQVEVTQKLDEQTLLRLNVLNKGDCFGEIAVEGLLSQTRTATVTCNIHSELLYLSTEMYKIILLDEDTDIEMMKRKSVVQSSNFFHGIQLHEGIYHQMIHKSTLKIYEPGTVILNEGDNNSDVYFIISGIISVRKLLTVKFKRKKKLCTKIVNVEYAKITGNTFPELILPEKLGDLKDCKDIGNLFLEIKHKLIECGYCYPAYATIVAEGSVKCLSIARLDLFRFATPSMIKILYDEHTSASYQPVANITEDYYKKMQWGVYKRSVISDIHKKIYEGRMEARKKFSSRM